MSIPVPPNPFVPNGNARSATHCQVRIGTTLPLTAEDEVDYLEPVEMTLKAGGGVQDHCQLIWDLGKNGDRVQDYATPEAWSQYVEVWMPNDDGEVTNEDDETVGTLLFWGELAQQNLQVVEKSEGISLLASVQPRHFGEVLYNAKHYNYIGTDPYQPDIEFIFNPEIDGKIEPNCSAFNPIDDQAITSRQFVHPESVRTGPAQTENNGGAPAEMWTMALAVAYLLNDMNGAENWIDNPTNGAVELEAVFATAPALRDIKIPRGEYLPKVLDTLLHQHGYGWSLLPTKKEGSTNRLQIAFFKYGEGIEKQIFLQRPGEDLDLSKTAALQSNVTFNVADLANRVYVQGDFIERELTVELIPAWASSDDVLEASDLERGKANSLFETDPSKRDVWRKWVLGEAGDYAGLRSDKDSIISTNDALLATIFGAHFLKRRRRFMDCLAFEPQDKVRRDPFVQWMNPTPDGGGDAAWEALPAHGDWGYHVLQKECGIYFSSTTPPQELINLGAAAARIRITATIRGDTRLSATASRQPTSPNGSEITLFLDMRHQFADRQVHSSSALVANASGADNKSDASAIQAFADSARGQEDAARLSAKFMLHGLRQEYQIGQILTKIDGRNIDLNRNSQTQATKKYLQIVGITHNVQDQTTELEVDTLELKKSQLDTGTVY